MAATAACFHKVRNFCCDKLKLKINLRTGMNTSEQPLFMELGITSPTEFDNRVCLIAF
jgi:hypothetical protein